MKTLAIQNQIQKLIDDGSKNWEGLAKYSLDNIKPLYYNLPQILATHPTAKKKFQFLEWGRGTGKTTILGANIKERVYSMPRSVGVLVGPSYQMILTRIIPSLIHGLEQQGLYQGLHYFIGKKPPAAWGWRFAHQAPVKFDNYITFWNGTGCYLISQDKANDGRGLNIDWAIVDEAAILNKRKWDENIMPTLRGSHPKFKRNSLHCSVIMTSSTPLTPTGKWFVEMEKKAIEQPQKYFFLSADCRFNLHNLTPTYLKDAEETAQTKWIFEAEYMNKRPNQVENGFYALLEEEKHTYTNYDYSYYHKVGQKESEKGDADLVKGKALILGVDWGAAINGMDVCQEINNEIRVIKTLHVLGANKEIQSDLFTAFDNYYQNHKSTNNRIIMYYDNTGNNDTGITKQTRAEQARTQLQKLGWSVQLMTEGGSNMNHSEKQMIWEAILKEDNPRLPRFRINFQNSQNLWISMSNAPAKTDQNGNIKKDKSSERSKNIPRQHATDLSDAIDSVIVGRYGRLVKTHSDLVLPQI